MLGLIGHKGSRGLKGTRVVCVPLLILLAFSTLLTMQSCSTSKAKWANIRYHNLTAHYNVWWNGNESLKEGVKDLNKKVNDDYTQILPVYKLGTTAEAMSAKPKFDRAIEKGVKGIKKHSIFVYGKEHVPYIRKCYMLTSYGSFYEHDYVSAENTCQMMSAQFAGTKEGDEAKILMARCHTADKQYMVAEQELDQLVQKMKEGAFAGKLDSKLYMAMVESLLPQERYKKAVEYIKLALETTHDRETKARLYFIMAQIYQKLNKKPTATKYYQKAIKNTELYVMEFNARLNIASCADLEHTDIPKLEKQLNRMLKESKNEEYRDQIYYAMGEMYMGVKNAKKACDSYKQSVAVSTKNQPQKAKSALRLAEVLYDVYENYDLSQNYYDTAMQIITREYPHYGEIKSRYDVLTALVSYTRVIDRNDSLIAVSEMPAAERDALIRKKIEDLKKQEEEAKERELLAQIASDTKAAQNTLTGDWYFYNHNTVQKGKETFRQRWGMRTLEDYWFLSKKGLLGMNMLAMAEVETQTDTETDDSDTTSTEEKQPRGADPNDPHNVAYYTKDLPTTIEQKDSMRAEIAVALLNAGYIYYDGIGNVPRALECYLRMANEFPENDEIVQAFYMLYRIYTKQGNTPQANYYRDMILMGFPDSDYANLIRDEDYYKEIIRREQRVKDEYEDLYAMFRKRRYNEVINQAGVARESFAGDPMLVKFDYWKAMSYARIGEKEKAIAAFENIIAVSDKTDSIVPLAQLQLKYLKGDAYVEEPETAETITPEEETVATGRTPRTLEPETPPEEEQLPAEALYFRYKESLQHYVIILVNDKKIRATEFQYRIADFNAQYYSNAGYKVNALMFTDSTQMVTIHRFKNAAEAMLYYTHLQQPESPLNEFDSDYYEVFPISTQNYTTFYNRKNVEAYRLFFRKYYR